MIEIGHDVLMRVPGEPTTLKWVGLAMAQVGARRLALRALEESATKLKKDAQLEGALAQLRGSFSTVRIEVGGLPDDPQLVQRIVEMGDSLGKQKQAERITLPGISEDDRKKLAARVAEIEKLGGVPAAKPQSLERSGQTVVVTWRLVEGTAPVKLHASLGDLGFEDVDLEIALKPGEKIVAKAQLRELPRVAFDGPGAAEPFSVDGKPMQAAGGRIKVGSHELVRQKGGARWALPFTVAPGEQKTVTLEAWPEAELVGWQAGDQVRLGNQQLTASGGRVALPPGKHALKVMRGMVAFPVEVTTGAEVARVPLPAMLSVSDPRPGMTITIEGVSEPWIPAQGASFRIMPPGPVKLEARLPGYEPVRVDQTLAPGQLLPIEMGFRPTEATVVAGDTRRRDKRIGWGLTGTGIAALALAGGSAGLWAVERNFADAAYVNYKAATNIDQVRFYQGEVDRSNTASGAFGYLSIGLGAVGVACVGAGIYFLARRSPR
jgi:hypothetical protein